MKKAKTRCWQEFFLNECFNTAFGSQHFSPVLQFPRFRHTKGFTRKLLYEDCEQMEHWKSSRRLTPFQANVRPEAHNSNWWFWKNEWLRGRVLQGSASWLGVALFAALERRCDRTRKNCTRWSTNYIWHGPLEPLHAVQGSIALFNNDLNLEQERAVLEILGGFQRPMPYVICGPPGTIFPCDLWTTRYYFPCDLWATRNYFRFSII